MKTSLIAGVLGAGILLTGCATTVVERGHTRYGERDTRYRDRDNGTRYVTRNIEQTNVHKTNIRRDNVSSTSSTQSRGPQASVKRKTSTELQKHTAPGTQQPSRKDKGKVDRKKHQEDTQANQ